MRAHRHLGPLMAVLVLGSVGSVGCGGEPVGEPAFESSELDEVAAAVRVAIAELEERQGVAVDPSDEEAAVEWVRAQLAAARTDDTGSQSAALEEPDQVLSPELGESLGGGQSTSGGFGTSTGGTSGSFGTSTGGTSGSFGTSTGGTGGSFGSGTPGGTSGSFGSSTTLDPASIPCRNRGVVTAIGEEDLANLTFGIDCVTAGSRPLLQWPTISGAPYDLLTIAIDLQTVFQVVNNPEGTSSTFLDEHVWGPLVVGGTSITYGGPSLTAAGGAGIFIGGVESTSTGEFGLFIAIVLPF